ncbi:MAG: response regulator [Clostridia bacterium]|nr:response regulator [Clostridia bacterium]
MSYTILCLDDHIQELQEPLIALKKALSVSILPAEDIRHADRLLNSTDIDLFILDIELSEERTTGISLARDIRCIPRYARTPILFISTYSHYSRHLLSSVAHSAFLPKPFTADALIAKVGLLLGIDRYIQSAYRHAPLTVSTKHGVSVEIEAHRVSFIALEKGELAVQYIDGQALRFSVPHGVLQELLAQIEEGEYTELRQIYRSVIINVEQIRSIDLNKNSGEVWLFRDNVPKPVGNRYRRHLEEFLPVKESSTL